MPLIFFSLFFQVIYFTDPVDEYLMQNLTEYEEKKFQNASKEDLKIGTKKEQRDARRRIKEAFKDLTAWWKKPAGARRRGRQGTCLHALLPRVPLVCPRGQPEHWLGRGGGGSWVVSLSMPRPVHPGNWRLIREDEVSETATRLAVCTSCWVVRRCSDRLALTPCIMVTSKDGWSAS